MANRNFQEFQLTLEKRLITLYCSVSVAGGGAVTFQKWTPPQNGQASAYGTASATGLS